MTAMPTRLRTLPSRHGGPVVLGLLVAVLLLGLGLRVHAALTPPADVGNDAAAYMAIAEALYESGVYGGPNQDSPNDWSPGAPLLYAAVYELTGGVHTDAARLLVALLGVGTILLTYLLAGRLAGPVAGLVAALLAATYPAFIENTGRLLAEPVALFWLPAALLAFLWASDGGRVWRWLLPGALLGLTTLTRPEYLPFVAVLAVLALARVAWTHPVSKRAGLPGGIAAAALLTLAFCCVLGPWTARNYLVLDRFVPVTTGGGKALYIATYLPGKGRQQLVKRELIERYHGRTNLPYEIVRDTEMEPLLDRVAKRYPELNRDAALGRIGRENFAKYVSEQPFDYAWMVIRKIQNMWDRGSSTAMSPKGWFAYHRVLVFWALAGLVGLAWRRRWETVPIGLVILGITLVGGLLLAVPRRALPLMPMVLAFTAVTVVWLAAAVAERRAARSGPAAILPRASWS
jgi:4-amino-4-deoxy-L-arabinose transferase-like glycosyltransferase